MIHTHRAYFLTDPAIKPPSPNDAPDLSPLDRLASWLTEYTWTGCTGYLWHGVSGTPYVLLNDSFSEDGAQEYVVLRPTPNAPAGSYTEIESITFGWMTADRARASLQRIAAGDYDGADYGTQQPTLTTDPSHRCPLCA